MMLELWLSDEVKKLTERLDEAEKRIAQLLEAADVLADYMDERSDDGEEGDRVRKRLGVETRYERRHRNGL